MPIRLPALAICAGLTGSAAADPATVQQMELETLQREGGSRLEQLQRPAAPGGLTPAPAERAARDRLANQQRAAQQRLHDQQQRQQAGLRQRNRITPNAPFDRARSSIQQQQFRLQQQQQLQRFRLQQQALPPPPAPFRPFRME